MPKIFDKLEKKRVPVGKEVLEILEGSQKFALKIAPTPGVQTLVNDKSQKGLPTWVDHEKQVNLPPGSATPGGEGRDVGTFSFNGPDSDSDIKPRTLGIPGEQYGHPTKYDYNTVTRRYMQAKVAESIAFHGWGMDAQDMRMPGPEFTDKKPIPPEDIQEAITYLEEVKPGVMVAYSRGGAIAMLALKDADASPRVLWVAPAWRRGWANVSPPSGTKGVILHGDKDDSVPLQHSCDLSEQTGMPLRVVPDRSHVSILKDKTNPGAGVNVSREKVKECVNTMPDWGTGGKGSKEDVSAQQVFTRSLISGLVAKFLSLQPPYGQSDAALPRGEDSDDEEGVSKEAYQRKWQQGKRQRRSRGSTRTKRRNYNRKNKNKRKRYSKNWRKKNRNNSAFKSSEKKRRRSNRTRRGSVLTVPDIAFLIGPEMFMGYVHSVSPFSGMVTIELDETNVSQLDSLPVEVFLRMAVFLTERDIEAFFDLVDVELGPQAYEDLDESLLRDCAKRYDRDPDSDEFKDDCFELTDEYDLSSMSADQLEVVSNSIIQDSIEGGFSRSTEDADDPDIPDSYDPHLFYGEVESRVASRWMKSNDVILYDQYNPSNNEIKQPGKDVDYRAEGPSTYTSEPDEKEGVVPGGRVPSRQLDDVPPASSRVIPDSMVQNIIDNYSKFASATIPQILSNCGPLVTERSKDIEYRRKRLSPSGISTWTAVSATTGDTYTIRVKPVRKDKRHKIVSKMPVRVSCTCPFWRWSGPEHWGKTNDYLYGKPRGTASFPVIRDPKSKHWACKHVIAVLQLVKNYRLASEADWSYEGPLLPLLPLTVSDPIASAHRVARAWYSQYI